MTGSRLAQRIDDHKEREARTDSVEGPDVAAPVLASRHQILLVYDPTDLRDNEPLRDFGGEW